MSVLMSEGQSNKAQLHNLLIFEGSTPSNHSGVKPLSISVMSVCGRTSLVSRISDTCEMDRVSGMNVRAKRQYVCIPWAMQVVRHETHKIDVILHRSWLEATQIPIVGCKDNAESVTSTKSGSHLLHQKDKVVGILRAAAAFWLSRVLQKAYQSKLQKTGVRA